MRPFAYRRPGDVAGAVAMLAQAPNGTFLAGGTNLVDLMRLGVATPDVLVDVGRLTSDRTQELPDGGLRVGAAVPNSQLAAARPLPGNAFKVPLARNLMVSTLLELAEEQR